MKGNSRPPQSVLNDFSSSGEQLTSQNAAKPGQTESDGVHLTGVENPTAHLPVSLGPQSLDRDVPLKSGETTLGTKIEIGT